MLKVDMHNHKGKTKTAMLLELESIKGLLVEEDDIPILQEEVIAPEIPVLDVIVEPEDLAEAAIPLLVVVEEEEFNAQPQFAIEQIEQEDILGDTLSWPELPADDEISLKIDIPLETELQSEVEAEAPLESAIIPEEQITLETGTADITDTNSIEAASPQPELIAIPTAAETTTVASVAEVDSADEHHETATTVPPARQFNTLEQIAKEVAELSSLAAIPERRAEQQQDFFQSVEEHQVEPELGIDSPSNLTPSNPTSNPTPSNRPVVKPAGQNPFLPEHIRARLHGGNTSTGNNFSEAADNIHSKRFKGLPLGNLHSPNTHKPSPIQQQLINEIMDKMLPEMAKELRGRLEKMSKKMLEELLGKQ